MITPSEAGAGEMPPGPDMDRDGFGATVAGIGKWVLAAAFLAAPLTTLRPAGGLTVGDILLALAMVLALVLVVSRRRLPAVPALLWAGGITLLVSIVVVQIFPPSSLEEFARAFKPPNYGSSFSPGIRLIVALIVIPVAVSFIINRWSTISLLVNAWVLGALISCAVAFLDAYLGLGIQTSLADNSREVARFFVFEPPRYVGLAVHPNSLGITAVLASPLLLARMIDPRRVMVGIPLYLVLFFGVLLSGSRSALLGIILAGIVTVVLSPRVRGAIFSRDLRVNLTLAAALVVTLVLVFVVPTQPQSEGGKGGVTGIGGTSTLDRLDPGGVSAQQSDDIRWRYTKRSVEFILDRPVPGYGFQWIETSHNIYLQLLLSGGLLALIGFLLVVSGYLKVWMTLRSRIPEALEDIRLGLFISLLMFLAMGLVSPDLLDRYLYLPAALVLALAALVRFGGGPDQIGGGPDQARTAST